MRAMPRGGLLHHGGGEHPTDGAPGGAFLYPLLEDAPGLKTIHRFAPLQCIGLAPGSGAKKGPHRAGLWRNSLGWLMGLEPTTTRITIWDSTN